MCVYENKHIRILITTYSNNKSNVINLFPDAMKLSRANYKPISLLISFSKVFEKVIYEQLYSYMNHTNLLSESDFGFRFSIDFATYFFKTFN